MKARGEARLAAQGILEDILESALPADPADVALQFADEDPKRDRAESKDSDDTLVLGSETEPLLRHRGGKAKAAAAEGD